ncbi:hypothetical protein [Denitratimonas sp. CY0512]|uniref:hypothetical protein n=1 Tax=Denitratimonas sp. CY0512 TaxID=3131940 RepID=UPI0030A6846F
MNRRAIILAGVVAVTVFGVIIQWGYDVIAPKEKQQPDVTKLIEKQALDTLSSAVSIKSSLATPLSNVAAETLETQTLPSVDTPVIDYFDELAEQARNGDEQAGCRLALDLQLCAMQPLIQAGVNSSVEFATELPPGSGAETRTISNAAYFSALGDRAATVCDGLTPAQVSSSWQYMLMAANQGSTAAAVRFAGFPPMMANVNNFAVDAEAWAAYRDNAPHLLEFAAQHGDPRALFILSGILSGRDSLIGFPDDFFEQDLIRAAAYALALMPIADDITRQGFERRLEGIWEQLSETEALQARQMAEQVGATMSSREQVIDFASGIFNRLEPQDCEEP